MSELNNNVVVKNKTSTVVFTLSQCVVYRWQEDNNKDNESNNQVIEKEILGQGKLLLTKEEEEENLHQIKIKYGENEDENVQLFNVRVETPILVYQRGHYVLQIDNYFYGLLLPENIPAPYIDVLERILLRISCLVVLPPNEKETQSLEVITTTTTTTTTDNENNTKQVSFVVSTLKSASNGVNTGSESIVNGILTASAMISIGLRGGGFYLKSKLDKNEEATTVSPFVVKSVDVIKGVTPYAKQGSTMFINSVSYLVAGVGNGIVSGVKFLLPENQNGEKENETFNAAVDFGKQSFQSISSIVGAVGDGISQIYQETTSTTVDVLNHKYGEHVASVTDKTFSASKDIFDTAMNIRGLGFNIAKTSGKEIVNESFIKSTIITTKNETLLLNNQEQQQEQQQQQQQQTIQFEQQDLKISLNKESDFDPVLLEKESDSN